MNTSKLSMISAIPPTPSVINTFRHPDDILKDLQETDTSFMQKESDVKGLKLLHQAALGELTETVFGTLVQKRDKLAAQAVRLDYRMQEIRHVRNIIERDARVEFGLIIERLRNAESEKMAVLDTSLGDVERDIQRITDIVAALNDLNQGKISAPLDFAAKVHLIRENVEYSLTKPIHERIDVYPDDLPRELTDLKAILRRNAKLQDVVRFKDEVIWHLLAARNHEKHLEKDPEYKAKKAAEANNIGQEYNRLLERFSEELKKYQAVCFFCGEILDPKSANRECRFNFAKEFKDKKYSTETPPEPYFGTRRHHYGPPIPDIMRTISEQKGKETVIYKNQFHVSLDLIFTRIRRKIKDEGVDLETIFKQHDKEKNGERMFVV
eukprot:TRINITY_DN22_c0_g4_i1.p1 TRINITY_DN22_c0_g4~~TRINITY_DN22_c0_g4_i1.p1  ORF type:complete len:381 (+),score=95.82 TRINITY_DN22_c0_g4_i1:199-1341(+)